MNTLTLTNSSDLGFTRMAMFSLVTGATLPSGYEVPDCEQGKGWIITDTGKLTLMTLDDWEALKSKNM